MFHSESIERATPSQLASHNAAKEIRERLRRPQNAVKDLGIDLKRKRKEPEIVAAPIAEPEIIELPHASLWLQPPQRDWLNIAGTNERATKFPPNLVSKIVSFTSDEWGVSRTDILSQRRTVNVVEPRHAAMYISRVKTPSSLPEIGRRIANRDHTCVHHAARKFAVVMAGPPCELQEKTQRVLDRVDAHIAHWRSRAEPNFSQDSTAAQTEIMPKNNPSAQSVAISPATNRVTTTTA